MTMVLRESRRPLFDRMCSLSEQGHYRQALVQAAREGLDRPGEPLPDEPDSGPLWHLLANLHRDLGAFARAEAIYLDALGVLAAGQGKHRPEYARGLTDLGRLSFLQGRYDRAAALYRQALEIHQRCPAEDRVGHAACLHSQASLHERYCRRREALADLARARDLRQGVDGVPTAECAASQLLEARLMWRMGQPLRAESLVRQTLALCRSKLGEVHPETARAACQLGTTLVWLCRAEDASSVLDLACRIRKETLGDQHAEYALSLEALARLRLLQARFRDALPLARQAVDITRAALGNEHPDVASGYGTLGYAHEVNQRWNDAEQAYRQGIELLERTLGENHPAVADALRDLARVQQLQGDSRAADETLSDARRRLGEHEADADDERICVEQDHVRVLLDRGRLREGQRLARSSLARARASAADDPLLLGQGLAVLSQVCCSLGEIAEGQRLLEEAARVIRPLPGHHAMTLEIHRQRLYLDLFQGNENQARQLARDALERAQRGLGEGHPLHVDLLRAQADLHHQAYELDEAEQLYERALELMRPRLGAEHPERAATLRELARLYLTRGNQSAAEVRFRQALEMRQHTLGEKHPECAESLDDLAGMFRAAGKLLEAEALYRQALAIRQEKPGEDHPSYASSLHQLATVLWARGESGEAENRLLEALRILHADTEDEHPTAVEVRHTLALVCQARGDYVRAETLLLEVLKRNERLAGENHLSLTGVLSDIARLYVALGDYLKARPHIERVRTLHLTQQGPFSPGLASALADMAELYLRVLEPVRAEPLCQQGMDILRQVFGEDCPLLTPHLEQHAGVCQAQQRFREAAGDLATAVSITRRTLGEHPVLANLLASQAALEEARGRPGRATPLYEQAAEMLRHLLGEDHPDHAGARRNLGLHLQRAGRRDLAEPALRRCLEITRRTLGAEHPAVAGCLQMLGDFAQQGRDWPAAERYFKQALDLVREGELPQDAMHAALLHNLAITRRCQGNLDEAEQLLAQVLEIDAGSAGAEAFGHQATQRELAWLDAARGRTAQAARRLSKLLATQARCLPAHACLPAGWQRSFLMAFPGVLTEELICLAARCPDDPATVRQAFDAVLAWKGIDSTALGAVDLRVLLNRYPKLIEPLERYTFLGRQLAIRMVNGPGAEGLQTHNRLLAEWQTLHEELAERVAAVEDLAPIRRLRAVNTAAVSAALGAEEVLVEYVRYRVWDFAALCAGKEGEPATRYAAFILPGGQPDALQMVDLGTANAIDRLIRRARWALFGKEARYEELRRLLLLPVRDNPVRTKLVVAPDGELVRLPWQRLLPEAGTSAAVVRSGRERLGIRLSATEKPRGWLGWL